MTAPAAPLSPACSIGECGYCPGDNVEIHPPGRRPPGEKPIEVLHCGHGCGHGSRMAPPVTLRRTITPPLLRGAA